MSFFNSLQQYVTDSVASLSLSPKRFSFSREDSGSSATGRSGSTGSVTSTTNTNSTAQQSTPHGYPKVVPPPGAAASSHGRSLSTRRRTLECTSSPGLTVHPAAGSGSGTTSPRRVGSFRRSTGSADRPPLMFCRRRPSWPEVDIQATSGVQETDGSFFESFTALSWRQENRRLVVLQEVEARAKEPPPPSRDTGLTSSQSYRFTKKELEQLYIEVLYTVANTVGASTGQYAHYKEDLYRYAQEAFGVPQDQHRRYLNIASEEKPPIVVLSVVVVEAEGLEAKDANGFSDPYCMLGIQPGNTGAPLSPQTNLTAHSPHTPPASPRQATRALSDGGETENSHHEKLRKHHSFRLSFKRKEHTNRREHRESLSGAVPAKFIRATTVKPHTLSPRWNEKFRFDIDDINTDILHLDIWDHDDESSVFDAVSKLNEVRGVKGLGRFFKQIAQSARSGGQDDFLGCVNIPLQDIPSTGLDRWYKLEARTQRSTIQGRIRLKLWLSTREDRGTSEEDNWGELRQQERLYTVFLNHEMNKQGEDFTGELPQTALTILHQHAVQGDVTELQQALVRWVATSRQSACDPKTLHRLLQELDNVWHTDTLSRDEEQCLADSFNEFLEVTLKKVRQHRVLFPPLHRPSISKLDYLLRCLGLLSNMKAFRACCPFNKEIRGEIITALRKGTLEWYEDTRQQTMCYDKEPDQDADKVLQDFTNLVTALLVDLEQGLTYYNSLFESTNGVPYFSAVYKQLDKLLAEHVAKHMENTSEMQNELGARVTTACLQLHQNADEEYVLPPGAEIGTPMFELYLALQDFVTMKENLPQSDHKTLAICKYYEWFRPAVDKWLDLAKLKAIQRVRKSAELDRICTGDYIVKHGTSAIDVTACFYQIKEFWKKLAWPDLPGSYNLVLKVVDAICSSAAYYAEIIHQKLAESGYYEDQTPYKTTDEVIVEMCVAINGLEYVRRWLLKLGEELLVEKLLTALECQAGDSARMQWRNALTSPLEQTPGQMLLFINQIVSRIGTKMRPPLKKAMFHLAWSPDSLPTSEAIAPLLEYLDMHLVVLNSALLSVNFNRVLQDIWEVVLAELSNQMDGNAGDKPAMFYERLHEALDLLVKFFHEDEKGLSYEVLHCQSFLNVEERLQYHKMDTTFLIDRFYRQRLQDQLNTVSSEYGVLTVRAYLNHDSLCVEVINARDVIPLDPNGYSDPFVIIELLPRRIFEHCAEQHTNVKKKTLNPMFDECFEFSVSVEQCRSPDAMVLFTVMDHDVLTANDFAGEAFLGLSTIPGVTDTNASIDNFHGLKHTELPLMHQKNRNHPILQILETRVGDKMALDFVKKQKQRFAST
ncbi:BAI1-associated protein 3 isoform X1 [Apis mellifera]|uniref:BAI1-associated protein 3 isoform X1 n=1 Tax=Apis mellifera TaxID=7460 RepID=A0A7M7ML14_APIME|nr:BAI1-associated protein 3 isoform X1 [Apis mellifera]XP_026297557.1 BAI1-associated protein 3 isoform X1 [Apis mellifera]XP_026297558.1 BAI1-associated protein 3 isoform X1 [Apis mellifera]|eukprot:XP_026297556.1 BAI1-associated protein 3 isoform X1 [Apis mellifera]